jgi:hypothetical protein
VRTRGSECHDSAYRGSWRSASRLSIQQCERLLLAAYGQLSFIGGSLHWSLVELANKRSIRVLVVPGVEPPNCTGGTVRSCRSATNPRQLHR